MPYATRADIENIFGHNNVKAWADLNNNKVDSEISARIAWALALADADIDAALSGGLNQPPFTDTPAYDTLLIDAAARLAGIHLYEGRGVVDDEGFHNLTIHKERVEEFLRRANLGRLKITGSTGAITYPMGVLESCGCEVDPCAKEWIIET